MCGIAGFYGSNNGFSVQENESILSGMIARISHRGPDDAGVWNEEGIFLGHRRLSILDLSPSGHQPMSSHCGRYVVVFNGEIYNYKQLRDELNTEDDFSWKGHSDTEVMLAAIVSWGIEGALTRFNGMFAFALWDRQEKVLTLARDRFGEKPLFYSENSEAIIFGSELTTLEAFPGFDRTIDRDSLCLYFRFRYIPAPHAVYKAAKKLKPACFMQWAPGQGVVTQKCYWNMQEIAGIGQQAGATYTDAQAIDHLDGLLRDAVALRMEADVPLGAFLSGGIDSSMVVALMQSQASRPVKTFSIGFDVPGYNEAVHAKAIAQYLGTDHTEQYVSGTEALSVVPKLGSMFDEPFADSSQIPTFLVSQIAKRNVTVCLSGDGGDEMFGGYSRYQLTPKMWAKLSRIPARKLIGSAVERLPLPILELMAQCLGLVVNRYLRRPMTAIKLKELLPWLSARDQYELYRLSMMAWKKPVDLVYGSSDAYAGIDNVSSPFKDFLHVMMYHDMMTYLPGDILTKVDRASMAVSLEGRIPLLDHRISEFSWQLPAHMKMRNGEGKWLLKQVLYKYVPKALLERPKMGFGVPLGHWLKNDLRDWADALLDPQVIRSQGLLSEAVISSQWKAHCRGDGDFSDSLWPVLMLQAWMRERAT